MGLLESITNALVRSLGNKAGTALTKPILDLLKGDGLNNLIKKFKDKGLGELVNSWVGTDKNKPISKGQVRHALGDAHVAEIAKQLGVPEEEALAQLSEALPNAVDDLTPHGTLPDAAELEKQLGIH